MGVAEAVGEGNLETQVWWAIENNKNIFKKKVIREMGNLFCAKRVTEESNIIMKILSTEKG